MVAGHLQEKKGYFYIVLNYKGADGVRKQPWFPTKLPVKGNKKKAEKLLMEMRQTFVPSVTVNNGELSSNMLFTDYMTAWLSIIKGSVAVTTFSSYSMCVEKKIVPYFEPLGITLDKLEAKHIQTFYMHELKTLSANSVIHEHANIHKALKYAVKLDLIPSNPADKIERPKKDKFIAGFYTAPELEKLFDATKEHRLALAIQMTAYYGLRRSELLGLKWDAFNFEQDTITIRHVIVQTEIDGKSTLVAADRAKTKSSLRTLPLLQEVKQRLLQRKEQENYNRLVCGNCYSNAYNGYVFVDELGEIYKPSYVTETFAKLLQQNGLRKIRFHDLRHSCASLLLSNGVAMKEIQEWLGHSDIATTSNIYAHLEYSSKVSSANVISQGLHLPSSAPEKKWG